jgi:hypothetical protein
LFGKKKRKPKIWGVTPAGSAPPEWTHTRVSIFVSEEDGECLRGAEGGGVAKADSKGSKACATLVKVFHPPSSGAQRSAVTEAGRGHDGSYRGGRQCEEKEGFTLDSEGYIEVGSSQGDTFTFGSLQAFRHCLRPSCRP